MIGTFYHTWTFSYSMTDKIEIRTEILKIDDSLGIVFGIGIICTEDGAPYYDTQGDWISPEEMLKASADFMLESRIMDAMHEKEQTGDVVFAMPMTKDVATAFNMDLPKNDAGQSIEALMLCVKPHSEEELQKFRDGTYTGFSLEGMAIREPVE